MGTTPPEPAAQSRPERLFPYSSPEPWTWIPGTWILPGTIFVTTEGEFYRFVERTDDGWKAEEVEPSAVGNPSRIAEIAGIRLQYQRALAAHDELDQKMRDNGDTPEARALLSKHDEELHRLRDQLILLCNGQSPEAKASKKPDQDSWKLTLAGVLALVFVLSLLYCVRSLLTFDRNVATTMLAGTLFVISGTVLSIMGVRELAKRKNRLVTGNLVGCWTLVALAVIVAAFGVMCYSVLLLYTGGYGGTP
jgi:cation transport ATPase